MKILRTAGLSLLFLVVVFTLATCGKHRSPGKTIGPPTPQSSKEQQRAAASPRHVRTQEDRMLIAMPFEDRLAYLEDKLKQLVYEMHGIVIEETVLGLKSASSEGVPATSREKHGVQEPADPENLRENLTFTWREATRDWRLSFYETLNGY
ncbi:hypothetical protein J7J84_01045 [bacterium]|nr:hypothetical protein [bacterium]